MTSTTNSKLYQTIKTQANGRTEIDRTNNVFTRSVQKIRGLFELRDSSWFQENPLGVASFVKIS